KRTDENQWWELYDVTTKRNYYYNAQSQRTIWQRPSNADIIPLAKLQMIKENSEAKDDQTIISAKTSTSNHTAEQLSPPNNTPSLRNNKRKQISLQGLHIIPHVAKLKISSPTYHSTTQQRPLRRTETQHCSHTMNNHLTSSMKFQPIKNDKSTYDNLANSIQYSLKKKSNQHYDNYPILSHPQPHVLDQSLYAAKRSQSIHLKSSHPQPISNNDTHVFRHISTPSLEFLHNSSNQLKLSRSSFGRTNIRKKPPRTNPNYVNIQIQTDEGSLRSRYIRIDEAAKSATLTFSSSSSSPSSSNSSSEHGSILRNNSQTHLHNSNGSFPSDETISMEKPKSKQKNEPHYSSIDQTNRKDPTKKQFVTCTNEFVFHSTTDPLSLNFQTMNNSEKKFNQNISSSILPMLHDPRLNCSQTINRIHESSPNLTRSISNHLNGLCTNRKNTPTSFRKQWVSSSLSTKSPLTITDIEADNLFHDMLNLNIHKRTFFGKRPTQENLLSWSKDTLTKPLLRTMDKILKKEAPDIFKLIQTYMGDRKSKQSASLNTCLELTTKGWSLPSIRDELFLQIIKQITSNYNAESLQRGWELMAICLSFFPPSNKFQALIERYVSSQTNGNSDTPEVPISIYAKVCQKRLEKILLTGPKKGLKKPSYEEIELSKHTIHFPSMFGTSLEEVMAMQRTRYPERRLPWIQT
ncbi:unnamed protein product, partial [Adineta ricciae]